MFSLIGGLYQIRLNKHNLAHVGHANRWIKDRYRSFFGEAVFLHFSWLSTSYWIVGFIVIRVQYIYILYIYI